ncbi:hypothetical protein SAMN05444422_101465 [Halobiforma haloterrestris]|uniref:Uncharacterized protein n=1 Tax=Natronobacterium haloterrestre TaxID=148448 RepID=A0A1I1DCL1_NATHA|nr:hypothetical protein [Halobiforma haloterrestris]SFB72092.1 hypothetical protein SAMN05444422_101465 [Halobiforma haloterrestris]
MVDIGRWNTQIRIFLYLLGAAVVVLGISAAAYQYFGSTGLTAVDLTVSALLTVALVILYFRQTLLLESQRDLLTQELNREARQQHTETLRDRVRLWHGNPDKKTASNPIDQPQRNLPAVKDASFETAPTGSYSMAFPDDEPFQVIPHHLQGDRYLEDLLQNHAPNLRKKKNEIDQLHGRFVSMRDKFVRSFEEGIVRDEAMFTIEPADYFGRWMFEFLVAYERGKYEDFAELRGRIQSQLEAGTTGLHPDEPRLWIRADIGGNSSRAAYSVVHKSGNREALREHQSAVKEDVIDLVQQVVDQLEEDYPYYHTEEAAAVLDEAAEAIDDLENLLVEYDGRPIYPGDCMYLEEARISGS